jgi:serine protease inhibitor
MPMFGNRTLHRATAVALIAVTTTLFASGCGSGGSAGSGATAQPPPSITAATEAATADGGFGFKLLDELNQSNTQSNILISPVSVSQCLMLADNGAAGQTATEIGNVLGFGGMPIAQADQDTLNLLRSLTNADPVVEIDIANAIWAQQGLSLSSSYALQCRQYLLANVSSMDFTNPNAAPTINQWVSTQTKGNITHIVDPPDLTAAVVVLANAVYFHGSWTVAFDPKATTNAPFTLIDGTTTQVPMMQTQQTLPYASDDISQVVSLPYGSGRLSMIVILPSTGHTMNEVVARLSSSGLQPWTSEIKATPVDLNLPRVKTSYMNTGLKTDLAAIGMPTAFEPGVADFSGMGLGSGVYISKVVHATTLQVDETGTTATGTTIGVGGTAIGGPGTYVPMNVNRPFFCAIYDSVTGAALFAGIIRTP